MLAGQFLVTDKIGLTLAVVRFRLTQFGDAVVQVILRAGNCRLRIAR